jgi:hypothetical protein
MNINMNEMNKYLQENDTKPTRNALEDFPLKKEIEQRYPTNLKYTKNLGAIRAKKGDIIRIYPSIDPQTNEPLGFYHAGQFPWAGTEMVINWAGIRNPKRGVFHAYAMNIIPSDIADHFPGAGGVVNDFAFIYENCPYMIFYNAMKGRAPRDPEAPIEWSLMTDDNAWEDVCGIKQAPLPDPERRVIVRGILMERGDEMLPTYKEGTPGLHPVVMEFTRSATKEILNSDGIFMAQEDSGGITDAENVVDTFVHKDVVDLENGFNVKLMMWTDPETQFSYYKFKMTNEVVPVPVEQVLDEYHDFYDTVEINGEEREPICNIMTCREQIEILTSAFGYEPVDYAFRNGPYAECLSDVVSGSFDAYLEDHNTANRGEWLDRYFALNAKGASDGDEPSGGTNAGNTSNVVGESKSSDKVQESIQSVSNAHDDQTQGLGVDPEKAESLKEMISQFKQED